VNTCAGCLPKVTGVQRLLPVLAARQKLPPETAAERKLLTDIYSDSAPSISILSRHVNNVSLPL